MKRSFRLFCLLLCFLFILSLIGCGTNPNSGVSPNSGTSAAVSTASAPSTVFPLKEPVTLTYWKEIHGNTVKVVSSEADIRCYQLLEKLTNVKIKWLSPPTGQATEQFNLLVASRELPDMIFYDWKNVAAGAQSYIDNDVIITLNDSLDSGKLPNYKAYINSDPIIRKEIALDSGAIYMFGCFNSAGHRTNSNGWIMRMDWLKNLNLDIPLTIEAWKKVLTVVKNSDTNGNGDAADEIPLASSKAIYELIRAYDLTTDFAVKNGKVVYSPVEEGYREWLTEMAQWYKEGLIDKEYVTTDSKALDAKVTGNKAFAWYGVTGSGLTSYVSAMKEKNPNVYMRGIPHVQNKNGITNNKILDVWLGTGTAITKSCKNKDIAMKWLDFAYGKEGQNLMVYGEEGVSYNWVNGYPKLADTLFNQPGLSVSQAIGKYSVAAASGAYVKTMEYFEQVTNNSEVKESLSNWMSGKQSDAIFMPTGTSMTSEEKKRYGEVMNDINTYVSTMRDKFIMGAEPLSKYDEFVKTIKRMNIDSAISIYQAAYDRCMKK